MAKVELKPLPPEDAIRHFEAKGYRLSESFAWQDVVHEGHAASHTVAKSTGFDILADIHAAVSAAQAEGLTFEDFQRRLTPILQAKGWWGRQDVVDPLTGETVNAQLGSPRRLRIIFDANLRASAAAGRWAQIQRTKATRPYLRYSAVMDGRTRPLHKQWHGTVLPVGDPWWDTHYPPNGWRCRCMVQQLSERDLARYGYKVSPAAPASPTTKWTNPRTGDEVDVPEGIDPGWAYNPGKAAIDVHAAQVAGQKLADLPPDLAAAAQAASARFLLPGLRRSIVSWIDGLASGAAKHTGERRVVGALTDTVLAGLKRHGIVPRSGAITLGDNEVLHAARDAKAARGTALSLDDLKMLPDIIAEPKAVLFDAQDPALLYVFDPANDPRLGKVVVRVDFPTKIKGEDGFKRPTITNSVQSGGLVEEKNLRETRYHLLDGGL